nr:hypothetical protein [Brevibacillus massiliensis]
MTVTRHFQHVKSVAAGQHCIAVFEVADVLPGFLAVLPAAIQETYSPTLRDKRLHKRFCAVKLPAAACEYCLRPFVNKYRDVCLALNRHHPAAVIEVHMRDDDLAHIRKGKADCRQPVAQLLYRFPCRNPRIHQGDGIAHHHVGIYISFRVVGLDVDLNDPCNVDSPLSM